MTGSSFFSVEKNTDGRSGGTTQAESRVYNERLIISLVRRHGQLSKADLTRLTGLAAQTITTIVNRAAGGGVLARLEPLRGKLGQPSVPYALNPDAAYSFGLKIDQRSADLALVNFVGEVVAFERTTFEYPMPDAVMSFTRSVVAKLSRRHNKIKPETIAGLGIASPFYQWNWNVETAIAPAHVAAWRQIDIRAELDRAFDWPVYLFNDAAVAAGAELMFGAGIGRADFVYAFIGDVLGGGLVLDHHLFPGRNRLAGALGAILVPAEGGGTVPLSQVASLHALASKLNVGQAKTIWTSPEDWGDLGPALREWIEAASDGLAYAVQGAVALLDVDNIVVDGAIPASVRKEVAKATRRKLARIFVERPEPFSVLEGTFGHLGPAIGGASIPLLVQYSNDKDLLFKE